MLFKYPPPWLRAKKIDRAGGIQTEQDGNEAESEQQISKKGKVFSSLILRICVHRHPLSELTLSNCLHYFLNDFIKKK